MTRRSVPELPVREKVRRAGPELARRLDIMCARWIAPLKDRLDRPLESFRPKLVNDPIWGAIELLPWEVALLDTPLLQRMRGVRQLGLAQLVFPGACHDRLEHIIGVVGAVEVMLRALDRQVARWNREHRDAQLPPVRDEDRYALRLAALFHDLGHGPFSHALEPVLDRTAVLRAPSDTPIVGDWRADLGEVRTVLKTLYSFNAQPEPSEVLAAMIVLSEPITTVLNDRRFPLSVDLSPGELQNRMVAAILGAIDGPGADHLSAVISSQVDADKLDYLQRDAHHAGLNIGFDTERLLARLEVLQVRFNNIDASVDELRERIADAEGETLLQLGIAASGFGSFEQMLIGRTFLYDRLYHHHKVRAAEAMAQRMVLVAERDREHRLELEDIFLDVGDEVVLRLFKSEVARTGFDPPSAPAAALAGGILDRNLLHRAFALRGRFIGVAPDLSAEKADQRRQLLWARIVDGLKTLKGRFDLGVEIHDFALRSCDALLAAGVGGQDLERQKGRLQEIGPEQIIVDLPNLKADAIRILARYPNGALRIPEFSFNPVKWSDAYELQKRTTYVFCPKDVLPLVAFASKIVFFGRYGVVMAKEADGFIKAGQSLDPAWLQVLVRVGLIDKLAQQFLTEKRLSLITVEARDLQIPDDWLDIDEDFGVRLAQQLNANLSGGLAPSHLQALGEALRGVWRVVDAWHQGGAVTGSLADEAELQRRLADQLRMAGVEVSEGTEVSGGETDLLLNKLVVLENKIEGVARDPESSKAAASMQGRRYAIAVNSKLVLVALAYKPAAGAFRDKLRSVTIHRITEADDRVEIRIALPYGAVVPSREGVDAAVRTKR